MPTLGDAPTLAQTILPDNDEPAVEESTKAKELINFLMQDRFFLALYRSNDPKVRATAMDRLNEAHHQAYGVRSNQ